MVDASRVIEGILHAELHKLREAERLLCAAFEKLPAERIPANSIIRFLCHLAEADDRMDRLELLLDILENSPLNAGQAA